MRNAHRKTNPHANHQVDGTCKGAGGSMHIYDQAQVHEITYCICFIYKACPFIQPISTMHPPFPPNPPSPTPQNFQGGWALVSEQLPYAVGAARSILLDRHLDPQGTKVSVSSAS